MADPILTADDLGTYLNDSSINVDRAEYLINRAVQLCESVVSPLPAGAEVVVERVAGRAYVSVTSARQLQLAAANAPFGAAMGLGGVWLTNGDRSDLRRLTGGGGAFSIDTTPATAATGLAPWNSGDLMWWETAGETDPVW